MSSSLGYFIFYLDFFFIFFFNVLRLPMLFSLFFSFCLMICKSIMYRTECSNSLIFLFLGQQVTRDSLKSVSQ